LFLTLNDFEENIKDSNFTGDFNKEQIKRIRAHLLRFRDARDLLSSSLFKSWYKLLSPEQRLSIKFEMNENTYVTLLQTILEGLFPSASLLHPHFAPSSAAFDSVLVPEEDLLFGQKRLLQTLLLFLFLPLQLSV